MSEKVKALGLIFLLIVATLVGQHWGDIAVGFLLDAAFVIVLEIVICRLAGTAGGRHIN